MTTIEEKLLQAKVAVEAAQDEALPYHEEIPLSR
jgi:hypothetical protein